ncbi:MAG TPA: DUF2505 domain-containing protein [Actinomycetota bacterium]|jgi:hypothetical protein|nr:DUF2505 domain-containing protein [Actinomycetota bacterium]
MRFTLENRIDAPLNDVEQASLDDEFQRRLTSLPNVHERRILSVETDEGGCVHRLVRYAFAGPVPAPVLRAIGGSTISWDEKATFDPSAHEWRFKIEPHVMAGRFECDGRYAFVPEGDSTTRIVEADIRVKIPIVGRQVERFISGSLKTTMNAEAAMLDEYLKWKREPAS